MDDVGAFVAGVIDGAHAVGAEHAEERVVADPVLAAREIGGAVDDVLVARQRDLGRSRGANHVARVVGGEHHGLPAEQDDLAVQWPVLVLANDRLGDVGCDSQPTSLPPSTVLPQAPPMGRVMQCPNTATASKSQFPARRRRGGRGSCSVRCPDTKKPRLVGEPDGAKSWEEFTPFGADAG